MLDLSYNSVKYARVQNMADFYKSELFETKKIHSIIDTAKLVFGLSSNHVSLEVAEGERFYKIILLTPDIHKIPFGWFVYLPLLGRLDLYTSDNPMTPFIQWKRKKVVYKGYNTLLDFAHVDRLFDRIVNVS